MNLSIYQDRDICWLHELAVATGFSRDFLSELVAAGDLEAIDMSHSHSKRRKLAVHRDSWAAFVERRSTSREKHGKTTLCRRSKKKKQPKDFLSRGKRKA